MLADDPLAVVAAVAAAVVAADIPLAFAEVDAVAVAAAAAADAAADAAAVVDTCLRPQGCSLCRPNQLTPKIRFSSTLILSISLYLIESFVLPSKTRMVLMTHSLLLSLERC
jgi:hypothetical protein